MGKRNGKAKGKAKGKATVAAEETATVQAVEEPTAAVEAVMSPDEANAWLVDGPPATEAEIEAVDIEVEETCPKCGGTGIYEPARMGGVIRIDCNECNTTGKVMVTKSPEPVEVITDEPEAVEAGS